MRWNYYISTKKINKINNFRQHTRTWCITDLLQAQIQCRLYLQDIWDRITAGIRQFLLPFLICRKKGSWLRIFFHTSENGKRLLRWTHFQLYFFREFLKKKLLNKPKYNFSLHLIMKNHTVTNFEILYYYYIWLLIFFSLFLKLWNFDATMY